MLIMRSQAKSGFLACVLVPLLPKPRLPFRYCPNPLLGFPHPGQDLASFAISLPHALHLIRAMAAYLISPTAWGVTGDVPSVVRI